MNVLINKNELQKRLMSAKIKAPKIKRGYLKLYYDTVLQADEGCDFDFLKYKKWLMNFKSLAPVGFLVLAILAIILPKDIFTAVLIFLMVLSGVIAIYTNLDIFDDIERDK